MNTNKCWQKIFIKTYGSPKPNIIFFFSTVPSILSFFLILYPTTQLTFNLKQFDIGYTNCYQVH